MINVQKAEESWPRFVPTSVYLTIISMSAYGAIARPTPSASIPLTSTVWRTKYPNENVTIHHLTLSTALQSPGLIEYLHAVFTAVLEEGQTYPMEIAQAGTYTEDAFQAYFFSADVLIAVKTPAGAESVQDGAEIQASIDQVRAGRSWEDSVAGFYYVRRDTSYLNNNHNSHAHA